MIQEYSRHSLKLLLVMVKYLRLAFTLHINMTDAESIYFEAEILCSSAGSHVMNLKCLTRRPVTQEQSVRGSPLPLGVHAVVCIK